LTAEVDVPVYRRFDFPDTITNRALSRHKEFFPNNAQPIDRNVYILTFSEGQRPSFSIVYHACHPVSRHNRSVPSADYVGAIRSAIRSRFGVSCCLFLQGCAGDIRPNFAQKRVAFLPRSRFNWRFKGNPSPTDQETADAKYADAVKRAQIVSSFAIAESDLRLRERTLAVRGLGMAAIAQFDIGPHISFVFLPFEVSHRYHLDLLKTPSPSRRFIVSCAGNVHGYLPHPDQHRSGGYEVERSRLCMGLAQPISIDSRDLWSV
jgi:hypothetical protein